MPARLIRVDGLPGGLILEIYAVTDGAALPKLPNSQVENLTLIDFAVQSKGFSLALHKDKRKDRG